mmetsp:Transcript_29674/g.51209  ORF Transcript_29674/g.51209 Transcript_29674/m.51209 type:complete len:84 (+) Transcript_29674:2-253(+)
MIPRKLVFRAATRASCRSVMPRAFERHTVGDPVMSWNLNNTREVVGCEVPRVLMAGNLVGRTRSMVGRNDDSTQTQVSSNDNG